MRPPVRRLLTFAAALLLGVVGAVLLAERIALHRTIAAVASPLREERAAAWGRLTARAPSGSTLAERHLEAINERLASAGDEALRHGADVLRGEGRWGWSQQPRPLALRELAARVNGTSGDKLVVASSLAAAPEDLDPPAVIDLTRRALRETSPDVAAALFEAACAWAGPTRLSILDALPLDGFPRLARLRALAGDWPLPPAARDERGDYARLAAHAPLPMAVRRWAAWHLDEWTPTLAGELLAGPVADRHGNVCTTALLAERLLARDEAAALADRWIRSFDDDEKRAGAALAALLGAHADLLQRAAALEDVPAVRTTQRVMLRALGRPAADQATERAFAHRALATADGPDPTNLDIVLGMLAAGDADALAPLTAPSSPVTVTGWHARLMLLERFAPSWRSGAGAVPGADAEARRLFADRLEARRLVTARCLRYDPATRTYTETCAEGSSRETDSGS